MWQPKEKKKSVFVELWHKESIQIVGSDSSTPFHPDLANHPILDAMA